MSSQNELDVLRGEIARLSTEVAALRSGPRKNRGRTTAGAIGLVACLLLAAAGTAQALPGKGTVDSGDIKNGQVKTVDLGANAVKSPKIADGTVGTADIAANAITSGLIADGAVGTTDIASGGVSNTDLASNAVTSTKVSANTLTGSDINEASLSFGDTTCSLEQVHSFARVKGAAGMPNSFTTSATWVDTTHNCSGGTIEVMRFAVGQYRVKINGDPAVLAIVTPAWNGIANTLDHYTMVSSRDQVGPGTGFEVLTRDATGALVDRWFNIVTY